MNGKDEKIMSEGVQFCLRLEARTFIRRVRLYNLYRYRSRRNKKPSRLEIIQEIKGSSCCHCMMPAMRILLLIWLIVRVDALIHTQSTVFKKTNDVTRNGWMIIFFIDIRPYETLLEKFKYESEK